MAKKILPFIEDNKLIEAIQEVVNAIKKAKASVDLEKNSLDVFSAVFWCAANGFNFKNWKASEQSRQAQKTIQNAIGNFHQRIIGSFDGCKDLGTGGIIDVENIEGGWVAEIKNKHNTVKGSDRKGIYDNLEGAIRNYEGQFGCQFTGYYVEIIPDGGNQYNDPFCPPDNTQQGKKRTLNENIRLMSGPLFYELMTGDMDALKKLVEVLPKVLSDHFSMHCSLSKDELGKLSNASLFGKSLES